jgi:LacI family transcriptional regulator
MSNRLETSRPEIKTPPLVGAARRMRVILLIESSRQYGRGCLRGIASYVRVHGAWNCLHLERDQTKHLAVWIKKWKPQGVIARLEDQATVSLLAKQKIPVIDLLDSLELPQITRVWTPPQDVCRSVLDHFLDRGYTRFAFCGYPGIRFSDRRSDAFVELVKERGFGCDVYSDPSGNRKSQYDTRELEGTVNEAELGRWLMDLPKSVAIMACNDIRGQQVVDACAQVGIRVPDQVAVVGVDNDEVVCDFSQPSLSSVELDLKGTGYQAAAALDAIMREQRANGPDIAVKPLGIVPRLSSDALAVDDEIVARAVALIREHACDGLNVEQILDQLPISRATLERRFARYFNRSPKEEIMRMRLVRAEQLLRETDLTLTEIAEMSGSKTAAHFSVVFKARCGITPGEFRNRSRPGYRDGDAGPTGS